MYAVRCTLRIATPAQFTGIIVKRGREGVEEKKRERGEEKRERGEEKKRERCVPRSTIAAPKPAESRRCLGRHSHEQNPTCEVRGRRESRGRNSPKEHRH